MEKRIVYFERPGPANTDETLRLALDEASLRGISKIILASTTGDTARLAARLYADSGITLVVFPHQHGFTESQRFPQELVAELEHAGHKVHFGTMLFHTDRLYGSPTPEAMAMVLRTICQGMKVCVEIVMMAADAGLVGIGEEVIAVSGTARGADTAVVALASSSTRLHELHITEILCKPLKSKSWARGSSPYDSQGREMKDRPL